MEQETIQTFGGMVALAGQLQVSNVTQLLSTSLQSEMTSHISIQNTTIIRNHATQLSGLLRYTSPSSQRLDEQASHSVNESTDVICLVQRLQEL